MKLFISLLFALTFTLSANAADNMLSAAEKADGWELLFDGKDISKNWRGFKMETVPTNWLIEDGAIFLNPNAYGTNGDIISREQYSEFEFAIDWKVAPASNSGIFYHAVESDQYKFPYETAPEMQVLDNDRHGDGKIVEHRAGDLYDLMKSRVENAKPVGEWNTVRIVVKGNTLQHFQNGDLIIETTMWNDNWKALIADSKFATWPGFGKSNIGHFALQDHGDPVWFKNLKVKKLN
ncbi:MAG: DUF1080 domain-containing protein [Kordiimonadaceae bacterium]|jgi:hypothetical protein|nr:DUF1080 domain-containing protein [Kordiimonadaceae bacterium]MBT6036407.1 DUF1080 domain-containing protein [Kordiimonadaceae bacterium]MBT6328204.1 DUF1080 domain-containing protein [Kordiimonadaceae bacterium]MBT7581623.1 DUF1080 domain-containing protein [Kordiimonadaceae bacterium]